MAEGPRDGGEGAGLRQQRGRALTAGKARGGGRDRRASRAAPGTVEGGGAGEGTRTGGWGGGRGQWGRQKRQGAVLARGRRFRRELGERKTTPTPPRRTELEDEEVQGIIAVRRGKSWGNQAP